MHPIANRTEPISESVKQVPWPLATLPVTVHLLLNCYINRMVAISHNGVPLSVHTEPSLQFAHTFRNKSIWYITCMNAAANWTCVSGMRQPFEIIMHICQSMNFFVWRGVVVQGYWAFIVEGVT